MYVCVCARASVGCSYKKTMNNAAVTRVRTICSGMSTYLTTGQASRGRGHWSVEEVRAWEGAGVWFKF